MARLFVASRLYARKMPRKSWFTSPLYLLIGSPQRYWYSTITFSRRYRRATRQIAVVLLVGNPALRSDRSYRQYLYPGNRNFEKRGSASTPSRSDPHTPYLHPCGRNRIRIVTAVHVELVRTQALEVDAFLRTPCTAVCRTRASPRTNRSRPTERAPTPAEIGRMTSMADLSR